MALCACVSYLLLRTRRSAARHCHPPLPDHMLWAARVVLVRLDPYRDEWLLSADKPLDEGAPHYERRLRSGATKHLFRFVEPATGTSNWRFLLGPTPGEGGVHGHDIRNRRDAAHGAEMAGGRRVWLSRRRGVYVYGDARLGGWAAGTQTSDALCEGVRRQECCPSPWCSFRVLNRRSLSFSQTCWG